MPLPLLRTQESESLAVLRLTPVRVVRLNMADFICHEVNLKSYPGTRRNAKGKPMKGGCDLLNFLQVTNSNLDAVLDQIGTEYANVIPVCLFSYCSIYSWHKRTSKNFGFLSRGLV